MSVPARVRLGISGRVQGVSYRLHAQAKARSLGLTGWVRNRDDGRVEALAEGPADALDEFIAWCGSGPQFARVTGVEILERHAGPAECAGFDITG